ncbi:hypothetical protein [Lamprocystis purpurea]|jgi:hypothetical protein|uniref:hypothetical protein n=1 Tax=Lamprocystis purpurea TaxID=61598 RepID=UPI00035E76E9|nr:hypothetical protein [Lamprocystis purpurea]
MDQEIQLPEIGEAPEHSRASDTGQARLPLSRAAWGWGLRAIFEDLGLISAGLDYPHSPEQLARCREAD